MTSRGSRYPAIVVGLGLIAAILYAGTASSAGATESGCAVRHDTGRAVLVADAGGTGATACAAGLAGSLCVEFWRTSAPLLASRAPSITDLCTMLTVVAHLTTTGSEPAAYSMPG